MRIVLFSLTLVAGAALGAIAMARAADAVEAWWAGRREQRRARDGRWRAHEQALIGRSIIRMR